MVAINKFTEMKIETFYITSENEFSNTFREWSDKLDLPVNLLDGKNDELHELVDGSYYSTKITTSQKTLKKLFHL